MLANPAACIARIRKSPEPPAPSPVKTRPVRFAPCAAGASPITTSRASGSPKPGTGRAQYTSAAMRGLLDLADAGAVGAQARTALALDDGLADEARGARSCRSGS